MMLKKESSADLERPKRARASDKERLSRNPDADSRVLVRSTGTWLSKIELLSESWTSRSDLVEEIVILKGFGACYFLNRRLHGLLDHSDRFRKGLGVWNSEVGTDIAEMEISSINSTSRKRKPDDFTNSYLWEEKW